MNILQNNPYRLLGVYSNSPTKERLANHNRMKAFLKVGKSVSFPLDVPQYLSSINRTEASVADAEAKLTLPKDQILYAQFWFVKITPLDDIAFKHLIAGENAKADDIWKKKECFSSLQNLIVSALIRNDLAQAVSYAEILYGKESYISQLTTAIVGNSCNFDIVKMAYAFLDVLCEEFGTDKLLSITTNNDWKEYIGEKAIKPLVGKIQDAIDIAKKSNKKGPSARLESGRTLMASTKDMLSELKTYLSTSDMQYQIIADKLAREILQCGIDYYNDTNDDDAPSKAMILQKYALSIAVGTAIKERCKENVDILTKVGPEYIVRNELARLIENLKELRGEDRDSNRDPNLIHLGVFGHSISDIKRIVSNSIPDIESMKRKLGGSSDLYIRVASAIVSSAVNALVEIVNLQQSFSLGDNERLRPIISDAVAAMEVIGSIDMDTKTRNYFNGNNSTLRNMNSRLNPSDSGACYIATMAYGDYNHPQVLILRHFRDLYLAQRNWGKWFIRTYYKYSPSLVEKLRNHTLMNKLIKKSLDSFILCIKNRYK